MFGRVVKHDHRKLVDLRERLFRIETGQKRMSWKGINPSRIRLTRWKSSG